MRPGDPLPFSSSPSARLSVPSRTAHLPASDLKRRGGGVSRNPEGRPAPGGVSSLSCRRRRRFSASLSLSLSCAPLPLPPPAPPPAAASSPGQAGRQAGSSSLSPARPPARSRSRSHPHPDEKSLGGLERASERLRLSLRPPSLRQAVNEGSSRDPESESAGARLVLKESWKPGESGGRAERGRGTALLSLRLLFNSDLLLFPFSALERARKGGGGGGVCVAEARRDLRGK